MSQSALKDGAAPWPPRGQSVIFENESAFLYSGGSLIKGPGHLPADIKALRQVTHPESEKKEMVRLHVASQFHPGPTALLPTAGVPFGVVLCDAVGHVGGDGAHLRRSFHVKHLIVKVDVGPDLLQHGALGGPRQEQSLVDLQPPGPERLQGPDT